MATEKEYLEAIHTRKLQDFDKEIGRGARLARFESVLGFLLAGLSTIGILLFVAILSSNSVGTSPSRTFLLVAMIVMGLIGVTAILMIKRLITGWLRQLLIDVSKARQKVDDFSNLI